MSQRHRGTSSTISTRSDESSTRAGAAPVAIPVRGETIPTATTAVFTATFLARHDDDRLNEGIAPEVNGL